MLIFESYYSIIYVGYTKRIFVLTVSKGDRDLAKTTILKENI